MQTRPSQKVAGAEQRFGQSKQMANAHIQTAKLTLQSATAKKRADQKARITTSKPKNEVRKRSPESAQDSKPPATADDNAALFNQSRMNDDMPQDYFTGGFISATEGGDSARERFEKHLPQDPNNYFQVLKQERMGPGRVGSRQSNDGRERRDSDISFKGAGSPIEARKSHTGLNESLMSVIGKEFKTKPQTPLPEKMSVEVVKKPAGKFSKERKSNGSIKPYQGRKTKDTTAKKKQNNSSFVNDSLDEKRRSQYDSFIDRTQPMFKQKEETIGRGPTSAKIRQARSPNVQQQSNSDYMTVTTPGVPTSSIYTESQFTRRSKKDRTVSNRKITLPLDHVTLGCKHKGLDKLRDNLEQDLLETRGALDVETKAKVDILEHEKHRLDHQIERLKKNKMYNEVKERVERDHAGHKHDQCNHKRTQSAQPDIKLTQRSHAARRMDNINMQSARESAAIAEKRLASSRQIAEVPEPIVRTSHVSNFDPETSQLSRDNLSADRLNKTGRASLLRFPLRNKLDQEQRNSQYQYGDSPGSRGNQRGSLSRSRGSPQTRSSQSPPREPPQQYLMPQESNRKFNQSVMSTMSRIDQLSQVGSHRKILELEAKLKVLEEHEKRQQRLKSKKDIDEELKLLQAQSNNLERSSRVNRAKMIQNTLSQRAKEKAIRDKDEHYRRLEEANRQVEERRLQNRTANKYYSLQRTQQLHHNRETELLKNQERVDKARADKQYDRLVNKQKKEIKRKQINDEKEKEALEKQAVLDRAAELEALINEKLAAAGRSELGNSILNTTARNLQFRHPIGPIEEEPLSMRQAKSSNRLNVSRSPRRNAPLGNLNLSREPEAEQLTAEFSSRQGPNGQPRAESARPVWNSNTRIVAPHYKQPETVKTSMKKLESHHEVSKNLTSQTIPDPELATSPTHAAQPPQFSMPGSTELVASGAKHRYSANSGVQLDEESASINNRDSNNKLNISRRSLSRHSSKSNRLRDSIGRQSSILNNLEPVRKSREPSAQRQTEIAYNDRVATSTDPKMTSEDEDVLRKSKPESSTHSNYLTNVQIEGTPLQHQQVQSGISPYKTSAITKKSQINLGNANNLNNLKRKKSLSRADIERLNRGGLIGDKAVPKPPSPGIRKSARSSRSKRADAKLGQLKSKYALKESSAKRETSGQRMKEGFNPVLQQRRASKQVVQTTPQSTTVYDHTASGYFHATERSRSANRDQEQPETVPQPTEMPKLERDVSPNEESHRQNTFEPEDPADFAPPESMSKTMPPVRQNTVQPTVEENKSHQMDRSYTETALQTQTNPLGDTINEPADTVFQPERTIEKKSTLTAQQMETDGDVPVDEGLPPANYDEDNQNVMPTEQTAIGAKVNQEVIVPKAQVSIPLQRKPTNASAPYEDESKNEAQELDQESAKSSAKSSKMIDLMRKSRERSMKNLDGERENPLATTQRSRTNTEKHMLTEKDLPRTQTEVVIPRLSELKQKIKDDKFVDALDKYIDSDNQIGFVSASSKSASRQQEPRQASEIIAKAKTLIANHSQSKISESQSNAKQEAADPITKEDIAQLVAPITTSSIAESHKQFEDVQDIEEVKEQEAPLTKRSEPVVKSGSHDKDTPNDQKAKDLGETPKFQNEKASNKSQSQAGDYKGGEGSVKADSAASAIKQMSIILNPKGKRSPDMASQKTLGAQSQKSAGSSKGLGSKYASPRRQTTVDKKSTPLTVTSQKPSSGKLIKTNTTKK